MKGFSKTLTALLLVLALGIFTVEMPVSEARADETAVEQTVKGEDFLIEVKEDYVPLFIGGIFNSEYDHYWHDYTAAIVGESMADMCVAMITFGGDDGTKVTFTKNGSVFYTYCIEY